MFSLSFGIPIGLILVILFTLVLNFFIARSKSKAVDYDAISEEERRANSSRRKEIPAELYIIPDLDKLPFNKFTGPGYEDAAAAAEAVNKKSSRPMIKFDKSMTNNEIKLMFGVANLEEVAVMEENYTDFIRAMIRWAEILFSRGEYIDAGAVLLETVRLKSDFSKSYTLLADVYIKTEDHAGFTALYDRASEENFLQNDIQLKYKILRYLEDAGETVNGA